MPPAERELKFLVDGDLAQRFVAESARYLSREIHDVHAPVAYTRTTYYDTADHALYLANGTVRRRLRLREYAAAPNLDTEPLLTGVRFFELKESANGSRLKTRMRLPAGAPVDIVLEQFGVTQPVTAQFTTWYRRTSYKGLGLRVTLDHGVAFCTPPDLAATSSTVPDEIVAQWTDTVLEVKLVGELPTWLSAVLAQSMPQLGLSKFDAGMVAMRTRGRSAA